MNKLSYNRTLAWIVLVVALVGAGLIGWLRKDSFEAKKATELLDVKFYHWIEDSADMLSDAKEKAVYAYCDSWNEKYHAVIAVATLPTLNGWKDGMDYGKALGEKWGLGSNDMLLLLVKNEYWYAILGDNVLDTVQMNNQQAKLEAAMSTAYYQGHYDEAVVAFFRQADVYYAQASQYFSATSPSLGMGSYQVPDDSGISLPGVLLLIVGIFVVWALLDRVRYNRYRRRTVVVGAPRVAYYPIFWGRRAAPPPPRPGAAGYRPPMGGYQPPRPAPHPPRSSGTYRSAPPTNRGTRPGGSSRGGFGGGGFGGKRR